MLAYQKQRRRQQKNQMRGSPLPAVIGTRTVSTAGPSAAASALRSGLGRVHALVQQSSIESISSVGSDATSIDIVTPALSPEEQERLEDEEDNQTVYDEIVKFEAAHIDDAAILEKFDIINFWNAQVVVVLDLLQHYFDFLP
jgi:NAD(P)H-hydrate repair Nnr-like enzyme with NAD(P)H-hydrate dehydratase domain